MNRHDILLLYRRELRSALRERAIVINSILIPLLLYPFLMWLILSAVTFLAGQEERLVSRVAMSVPGADPGEAYAAFYRELADDGSIALEALPADPEACVRAGRLDAVAEVLPPTGAAAALVGNFRLRLTYDSSRDRGNTTRRRLETAAGKYRAEWVRREAEDLGIDDAEWQGLYVNAESVASRRELGGYFLGLVVPLLMIIMIAVGCIYPAVDTTAGEHERSTWETLMTVAAARGSILVAKYLYVATLGLVAGLLNLAAMAVTMQALLGSLLASVGAEVSFRVPLLAWPFLVLGAALLALFLAAGMVLLASFARTFKEGQSMVLPFYLLAILPPLFVQSPDLELTFELALIPIVNVALFLREAVQGTFQWPLIVLTIAVEAATVAAVLALAHFVLRFEDVLVGSYSGSLMKLLRERWRKRPTAGAKA